MRRPDSSAIIGFLLFILVIVSVTAAIIMYTTMYNQYCSTA